MRTDILILSPAFMDAITGLTDFGLFLNLAGVVLVFRYGMPYRVRTDGKSAITVLLSDSDEKRRKERRYDVLGWLGLGFMVIGTILQVAGASGRGGETSIAHSSALPALLALLFVGGIGAYLGAYLRQKGSHLATKEDIRDITKSVEAVKAAMTSQVWLEQRRWDIKKEFYWDAIGKIKDFLAILQQIHLIFVHSPDGTPTPDDFEKVMRWVEKGQQALTAFERMHTISSIVVSDEVAREFGQFLEETYPLMDVTQSPADLQKTLVDQTNKLLGRLITVAKSDLKIAVPMADIGHWDETHRIWN